MDKNILREKIVALEGVDDDVKAALLGLLEERKKYGIVWEDKPEEAEERLKRELPVLREDEERFIAGASEEAPNHVLIEGDNLHALTALSYTHAGKVDVIYIDPPYNTGNKDFVYNDSYVDREDSYRHSKWLSFMKRRLDIAKVLLSDRGVIFISIDDNEQAQLKMLCDEVLGEDRFLGMVSRATGTTTGQDTGSLGKACDYILIYSMFDDFKIKGIPLTEKDLERYSLSDEKGNFSILQLRRTGGEDRREDRPTMFFPIEAPDGTPVYPYGPGGYESRWRVGPEKVKQMRKDNMLYFKKDKDDNWKVYYKFYSDNKDKRPSNLWTELDGNKKAQIEIKAVLPGVKFETPKPLAVINRIISLSSSNNSTILDFFAGSGTTLHAVMQLNAEDGGKRKCILVTNNENGICEEVTYERNRRVICGYSNSKGEWVDGLKDNALRYYTIDWVDNSRSLANKRKLMGLATDMLCVKNDLYRERDCFAGEALPKEKEKRRVRYFDDGRRAMLVVYDERVVDALVPLIERLEAREERLMIYVFSNTNYPHTDNFETVLHKVELCALPAAILNAYRNLCAR